jgi:D-glycero-D-manno-heptose 1,7-bisphosphate phosphatase
MRKTKAAFLDRDGTINKNYGYVIDKKKIKFLKNVVRSIKLLNKKKFLVIIITNQSGIARGLFKKKKLHDLHKWMRSTLKRQHAIIHDFYYCSYHPKFSKYSEHANYMRKPNPGMIFKAMKEHNIDLSRSFMIGDSIKDKIAAKKAGLLFYKKKKNLLTIVKKAIQKIN